MIHPLDVSDYSAAVGSAVHNLDYYCKRLQTDYYVSSVGLA